MQKCLIYEDDKGYCRIVIPTNSFQFDGESDENMIARFHHTSIPSVCEFIAMNLDKIPLDKIFRDAWKKGDKNEPIKVDFDKAIQIHRARLQEAAQRKIKQLDYELEIALEKDNLPEQVAIRKTKSILRTIHEMNMTHCKTLADIKFCVPKELHDVWTFYPLVP